MRDRAKLFLSICGSLTAACIILIAAPGSTANAAPITVTRTGTQIRVVMTLPAQPPVPAPVSVPAQPTSYTVQPGDTLTAISAQVGRTWIQLAGFNHLVNADLILTGQVIQIPPADYVSTYVASPPPPVAVVTYTAPTRTASTYTAPVNASGGSSVAPGSGYEACVIQHESTGNPTAVNYSSGASGLYGFLTSTFDGVTGLSGPASSYSPATQQAAFDKLYASSGSSPWSSDGC
jgi:LysM repeat protein